MIHTSSMHDDKSERESIFRKIAHSTVEDEEALLHLERILTASAIDGGDGVEDASSQHGLGSTNGQARTAIAPTISTLKARLRRNTLQRASSVEPLALETLRNSHDRHYNNNSGGCKPNEMDTQRGSTSGGVVQRRHLRRARQTSASASLVSSGSSTGRSEGLQWPSTDNDELHEPFADSIEAKPRTRRTRSSSDGQMGEVLRKSTSRHSSGSGSFAPKLATVPASPQLTSASSSTSTC